MLLYCIATAARYELHAQIAEQVQPEQHAPLARPTPSRSAAAAQYAREELAEDERVERQDACRLALRAPERRAAAVVEDPVALLLISEHGLRRGSDARTTLPNPARVIPSPSA